MEDSTAKTITYLRARLLTERSVSRTAKQRANELAKRVTELEKQLKFVSLQRKKAEKATVDVLAILENHGRNDLSEPFDSSSDQEEMSSDFKDGKHVETSKHGKVRESDTEGFSGSEVESSSVNGRSLSWKSSKNSSSRFLEKYMDASRRRRNSFASTGSSPRRVGKSCRQIRHKEHRSVADGSQNVASNAHCEDEGRSSSEGVQNSADVATDTSIEENKIPEQKSPPEISTSLCNGHVSKNNGTQKDMERALEHQAQFIAQYAAEENAQREWEDKFRENNESTRDSCDPGTHSDVTEERDETKTPPPAPTTPFSTDKLTPGGQETEDDVPHANFSEEPKIDTEPLLDQKYHDTKNKVSDDRNYSPDLQSTEDTPRNVNPAHTSSSRDFSLLSREEQAPDKPYEPTLEARENPNQLGSVLEALQQAKLSLKQNLNKFPLLENEPHRSGDKFALLENGPSVPAYKSSDKFPVPFSPASLFRLPTDYEYGEATTRANSLTYDSRLSLTNYPSDPSSGPFISSPYREPVSRSAESGRFVSSPFRESRSGSAASLDDRFHMVPTFPYQETRLETPTRPPSGFNPRSDPPLPPVADPRFSVHPSARDQRSSLQRSATDPRSDMPPSVDPRFSVHPSALDPRLSLRPSDLDPRLDAGMGRSHYDPRLDTGMGRSAYDPRLSLPPSATDPRLDPGMGRAAHDPRLDTGTGRIAYDPRLDMGTGRTAYNPRLDAGTARASYNPRLDAGMGRASHDPRLDAGMGRASHDPRLDMGMGRSLYDDYGRRNM
ncbi:hypothetical protein OSB04_025705 [Centaurea solstitialis]|uniref:Uncharacterized protein n=1 Tax=Centaurea solstitialis TaxID=347529 RepID=A0AA38SP63_9ASTR|nr:hypothetical protein OSB04_025705 [Centaurea solstitialis]